MSILVRSFIAGRSTNASLIIAIDRKAGDIQFATAYSMINLAFPTDTQHQVPINLTGIEPADRIAALNRQEIDYIDQCIYFI